MIVDAGSTLTPASAVAVQSSDLVVLVANPDVPCLRNLQRLLDAVRLSGVSADQLRVLLNRASDHEGLSIAQIEGVLGLTLDWRIPSDYRTVSAAITSGTPVRAVRTGDLLRHLEAVARAIGGETYECRRSRPAPRWSRRARTPARPSSGARAGCPESSRCTAARCTPMPRPWMRRTCP